MKFTIGRDELKQAIKQLKPATDKGATLPITTGIKISAADNTVAMTANNLEQQITMTIKVEVQEPGECWLSLCHLRQNYFEWFADNITIASKNNRVELTDGRMEIEKFGFNPEDFPNHKYDYEDAVWSGDFKAFRGELEQMLPAVSMVDSRKVLHGVSCEVLRNGQLRMVSTDGKRMYYGVGIDDTEIIAAFIIPYKTCRLLLNLRRDGKVQISPKRNEKEEIINLQFAVGAEYRLWSKTIQGNYPNYRQVIPATFAHEIILPAIELRQAVLAADKLTQTEFISMSASNGKLTVAAETDKGSFKQIIDIESQDEISLTKFSTEFLLDVVPARNKGILIMDYNDQFSPARFRRGGINIIIMPARHR